MCYRFIVSLSSICLAVASLSGCASEPESADEASSTVASAEGANSSAEGASVSATWDGEYHTCEGEFPQLTLEPNGFYIYDTGIRCVRAPCPSGDVGDWYLGYGTLYLVATSSDALEPYRTLEIVSTDPPTLLFEDRDGTRYEFVRVDEATLPSSCAAVLCLVGTTCKVVDGVAQCIP